MFADTVTIFLSEIDQIDDNYDNDARYFVIFTQMSQYQNNRTHIVLQSIDQSLDQSIHN